MVCCGTIHALRSEEPKIDGFCQRGLTILIRHEAPRFERNGGGDVQDVER